MKKTLTLLALLMIAGPQAMAETTTTTTEHWVKGVVCHDNDSPDEWFCYNYPKVVDAGAYTFSKNDADSYATNQCWAASAADALAWWEDRVEENGALIMHDTPRGLDLWKTLSPMFVKDGGYPRYAMNYWLWGELPSNVTSFLSSSWTAEHQDFHGYFPHLKGQMTEYNTEYIMIIAHSMMATVKVKDDPDCKAEAQALYLKKERELIDLVDEGWGLTFYTDIHVLTAYGFETDENGRLTQMWYTDNNPGGVRNGYLESTSLGEEVKTGVNTQNVQLQTFTGYGDLRAFNAIRTQGIQFDTYELTFDGVEDELLFSHYLNVTYDGGEHTLQYDLRNALDKDSPVTAKDNDGKLISTGDITLKKGTLSLVAGVGEYDGGGKTSGSITFKDEGGANRTLSVQHTDTIAKEIIIAAAEGNTLEVAEGKTASFGNLSGKGDLDKTGAGTAEVTGDVTLEGDIRVHEGSFIFGKDATISETTSLTVDAGAHVRGKEGESLTLTIGSGVHVNDGVMTLTTTVNEGATLKGSGTFAMVTIDGGEMIVGNSPGHQNYKGALTLNSGRLVFCAAGLDTANDGDNTGWASGTYSTINMNGHDFVVNQDGKIVIALSADAANSLTTANGTVELTLATGLQSGAFSEEQLAALAEQTSFELSVEEGAGSGAKGLSTLNAPKFSYKMVDDALVLTTGVSGGSPAVPEPATSTLSLLALAALAARRRRK